MLRQSVLQVGAGSAACADIKKPNGGRFVLWLTDEFDAVAMFTRAVFQSVLLYQSELFF